MSELVLMKTPGGMLAPVTEESKDIIGKWKLGQGVKVKATKARNLLFLRKFFAMLTLGFESWEPAEQEFNGLPVQKNFERFRKDCTIAAGFYDPVVNLKGEVRAQARSLAFDSMEDDEFEKVYSTVADVILQRILTKYTRADLDRVVDEMLRFCA